LNDTSRFAAFGKQLIEVHDWLREELARLRADAAAGIQPKKLQAHCLSFCAAVTRHHTGEDEGAFPALARQFPELRPVLQELAADHGLVTLMLQRLEKLDFSDSAAATRELNGIEAILESHFTYEERKIVKALDSLDNPEWTDRRPDFTRSD
jgi:hypothetical protein